VVDYCTHSATLPSNLHGPFAWARQAEGVDLSALSNKELLVLRKMVLELYDDYPLMEAGNAVLFIDNEIERR